MTDADTAGDNAGTGGDFTINGTLDTAQRGPNQDNCVASENNSTSQYLSKSFLSGAVNTKTAFTMSFQLRTKTQNDGYVFVGNSSSDVNNRALNVSYNIAADYIYVFMLSPTGTFIGFNITGSGYIKNGRSINIAVSQDTSVLDAAQVYINGVSVSPTSVLSNGTSAPIDFTFGGKIKIFSDFDYNSNSDMRGSLGELYLSDEYTDLSTNNPFWDADANRPKPVRQVLAETGNTPLIAMPIQAGDEGLNLGTGGNFAVVGGPFAGARGGSEYWARSAEFDGSTGNLSRAGSTISSGKTLSMFFAAQPASLAGADTVICIRVGSGNNIFYLDFSSGSLRVFGHNSSGTNILNASLSGGATVSTWVFYHLCFDLSDTGKRHIYKDGSVTSPTYSTYTNDNIDWSSNTTIRVGSYENGIGSSSDFFDGNIGSLYFTTNYIDFSQEPNRNLFVDQLGYPKDLTPAIDAGDIPTPLIYMKFDDPDNLGANSGTGGDFTVNGTVLSGSDVDPNA